MTQVQLSQADELRIARKERKPQDFVPANLFTAENVATMKPESLTAHLNYFQELVAIAGAARDFETTDILNRAIGEINTFFALAVDTPVDGDVPRGTIEPAESQEPLEPAAPLEESPPAAQGIDPHIPDSPGDGPGLPEDPEAAEQLQKAMDVLKKNGIEPYMLPGADDNDLLQINGIGQKRVDLIRAKYPKANA